MHRGKKSTIISYDTKEIIEKLDTLEEALEISNVSKIKALLEELKSYQDLESNEKFISVVIACETFDFDTASENVKALRKEF